MKNLLITLGDCWTEGVGAYDPNLLEKFKEGKISFKRLLFGSKPFYNENSWPTHLAKILNYDLLNLGRGNTSNAAIAKEFTIVKHSNYRKDYDNVLVVFAMTDPCSIGFYSNQVHINHIMWSSEGIERGMLKYDAEYLVTNYLKDDEFVKLYTKNFMLSPTVDSGLETAYHVNAIDNFCYRNGYSFKYFAIYDNPVVIDSRCNSKNNILKNTCASGVIPVELRQFCSHPTATGYEYFANIIGEKLKELV